MFAPMELIRRATADAERAERLYHDRSFRTALREGQDVFRTFEVTTLPPRDGRTRREIPASWRLRIGGARARPLLQEARR